eukprot:172079_1
MNQGNSCTISNKLLLLWLLLYISIGNTQATCTHEGKVCIYGGAACGTDYTTYIQNTLNLAVDIIDTTRWTSMSSDDFKKCNAIVFCDPRCSTDPSLLQVAENNANVWSAAVDGNILLIGSDEDFHDQGVPLIQTGLDFVTDNTQYCTGLYVSLSCYYHAIITPTPVSLLNYFGTFITAGTATSSCFDDAHIVAEHRVINSLTDEMLSNWACTVHEVFKQYPSNFIPLAIAKEEGRDDDSGTQFPDGTYGIPFILANNVQLKNDTCDSNMLGAVCDDDSECPDCMQCCRKRKVCEMLPDRANSILDEMNELHVSANENFHYYQYIVFVGVILFILINNVFIGYWCVCKTNKINSNLTYEKCEIVNVDHDDD